MIQLSKKNYILGINAYHGDASACLIGDGHLLAAAEEERFNRIKHWAGFPLESIKYCLEYAGIDISDINSIAVNHDPKSRFISKLRYGFLNFSASSLMVQKIKLKKKKSNLFNDLKSSFPNASTDLPIFYVEHHYSHLASAFYASNFSESICLSIDGFGDFASASWGLGDKNGINIDDEILFPHSLGIFYQAITQFLGFPNYGDEYKVMGLASYGSANLISSMEKVVKLIADGKFKLNTEFFLHDKKNVDYQWNNCEPKVGRLFSDRLVDMLGPPRISGEPITQYHKDIAASCQKMYENALFYLLNTLHDKYKISNLSLAGGCAMNSAANGRIYENTPFRKIYIQPAGGDAGGAIGAAFCALPKEDLAITNTSMPHAYWGPEFDSNYINELVKNRGNQLRSSGCQFEELEDASIFNKTAESISNGLVVGWFQGRMEWGPRALGNRSILGDPRREDMKDILNSKIKRRESFRPFAPSILLDKTQEWFEINDEVPFMGQVSKIKLDKRSLIPAVTHIDGTGRLQTVSFDVNAKFYKLIEKFELITGVPIVLNTSFNENEPIVCTPDQALDCFLRTNMDVLVLGNFYIYRKVV
jgi:carbamoyltransferase